MCSTFLQTWTSSVGETSFLSLLPSFSLLFLPLARPPCIAESSMRPLLCWFVVLVVVQPWEVASFPLKIASSNRRSATRRQTPNDGDLGGELKGVGADLARLSAELAAKERAALLAKRKAEADATKADKYAAMQKKEQGGVEAARPLPTTPTVMAVASAPAPTQPAPLSPPGKQQEEYRCGVCTVAEEEAFVRYQQQARAKRETKKAGVKRPEQLTPAAEVKTASTELATITLSPPSLRPPPASQQAPPPPPPPPPPPSLQQLQHEQQILQQQRIQVEQQAAERYRQQRLEAARNQREAAARRIETQRAEQWKRQDTDPRIVEERTAFENYRKQSLADAKKTREAAGKRWELARKELQQIEEERWKREEKNRKEEIGRQLSSTPQDVDIVAFRPPTSEKAASTRVSRAPLAVLSPEERAKMELSAAIVTLTAIGLKFGGPFGAVAFASAAKVYGEQGTAQGAFVRGLGRFCVGSVDLVQAVDRKFGITEAIDETVLGLIQSSVEPGADELIDEETVMMTEIQRTQQYEKAKTVAGRVLAFGQDLVEKTVKLMDRVIENVKKVE